MAIAAADVRKRSFLYLSAEVASCADMSLEQLQQFAAGAYRPFDAQLVALAARMDFIQGFQTVGGRCCSST